MTESIDFILDIMGALGGGRDSAYYYLTPYLLAIILWGGVLIYELSFRYRQSHVVERLLLASFAFNFTLAVALAIYQVLIFEGKVTNGGELSSTIEQSLFFIGQILLAAGFLQLLLRNSTLAKKFVVTGLLLCVALGLFVAIAPHSSTYESLGIVYTFHWTILLPATAECLFMGMAIYWFSASTRRIRIPIIIGFALFQVSCLARMAGALFGQFEPDSNNPVASVVNLVAIAFICYASIRMRQVMIVRQNQSLRHSERLESLGQLSSGIAHDFNNHLQIILGYVELGKKLDEQKQTVKKPLQHIEQAAEAAGTLVNQLLAFSRDQPVKFQPVDLNEIIVTVSPMLSRLLGPKYHLSHDLATSNGAIKADRRMIEQIIVNLVVNARDAMAQGGPILIQTQILDIDSVSVDSGADSQQIRLTVADTGIGMDEATRKRAFEPFYTTKAVGKGTGLGLATVYGIATKHNASVSIESKVNLYTDVHVDFPLTTVASIKAAPALGTIHRGDGKTILICEDEPAIRELATTIMANAGYEILIANDGQHAINIVSTYQDNIDLCVFDVTMPRLSGYQAYDKIDALDRHIPVLFITGNTSRAESVRQDHHHLQKPFSGDSLLTAVYSAMQHEQVILEK